MKKIILFSLLILIASCKCFVAGELPEKRKHAYEVGNEQDYCEKNPNRCIKGVPW